MKSTPILKSIAALQEERRELWARAGRLSEAERGRLVDIAEKLESLWNKRRLEKAGIDADSMPGVVVYDYEPDARHTRWARRGRGRGKWSELEREVAV